MAGRAQMRTCERKGPGMWSHRVIFNEGRVLSLRIRRSASPDALRKNLEGWPRLSVTLVANASPSFGIIRK